MHEFTDEDRERSAKATKRHYARKEKRGDVVTRRDCKLIDEGWHRFWMKRGGHPVESDEARFGGKGKPKNH